MSANQREKKDFENSVQKFLSAKWRYPPIQCPPFGDFFKDLARKRPGRIFCPLIGGSTVIILAQEDSKYRKTAKTKSREEINES